MRSIVLLLVGLLFGCSNAPLSVPLRDFDVDVVAFQNNRIVFVKQDFAKPPFALRKADLEGNLTYQTGFAFSFYATDSVPCSNRSNNYYVCEENSSFELIGRANFQSGSTQPLRFSGSKLTSGINSGNLWIGVKLDSGIATAGTLEFRNLVARVSLLP